MSISMIKYSSKFKKTLEKFLKSPEFKNNECFRIPKVRNLLTLDRFKNIHQNKIKKYLTVSKSICNNAILHNTSYERMFYSDMSNRPDLISKPLSSMNSVILNGDNMKVLSVGSRTEAEIFSLVDAGFNIDNIVGIDLFSYSELIKLGNVCNLPFPAETFDVIVCGWVLEFVTEIEKAALELKRVTKPGGLIAIGGMHHPSTLNMGEYNERKKHQDRKWYASVNNILKTFNVSHKECVFKSEICDKDIDKRGDVVVIFRKT